MREILFRGRSPEDGAWHHGTLAIVSGKYWIVDVGAYFDYGEILDMHQVDPETVGQYTGLKDKHGKPIFEGDIVKDPWRISKVEYYRGRFYPFISFPEFTCWDTDETDVIGNIHDNPELLEVKK